MISSHRTRRPTARLMVGALVAATIVAAVPAMSGASSRRAAPYARPAGSPPPVTTFASNGSPVAIGSNNWTLSVNYSSSGSTNKLGIVLTRGVTTGGRGVELHTWAFPSTTTSALKSVTKTKWTLVAKNTLANVNLTFNETGSSKPHCHTGTETTYTGTLTGTVTFNTELSAGTVKGTKWTAGGSKPTISVSSLCVPTFNPCTPLATFVSGQSAPVSAGSVGTLEGIKLDDVTVATKASVTQLKGTIREDVALLSGGTLKFNPTAHTVSVATTTTGIVTGSASISHGKFSSTSSRCSYAGKTYKQTSTLATGATYVSPAGKQLVGHTTLTPYIKVTLKSTSALWTDQTDTAA